MAYPAIGIDEAGRGPLAGPVVAAAVYLSRDFRLPDGITPKDPKLLSPRQRDAWERAVRGAPGICWSISWAGPAHIDRVNILRASLQCMDRALVALDRKRALRGYEMAHRIVVDGNWRLPTAHPHEAVPRADGTFLPCILAALLAKTARDRMMIRLHETYPEYGFDRHKGYGTRAHYRALQEHGACKVHRMTFRLSLDKDGEM